MKPRYNSTFVCSLGYCCIKDALFIYIYIYIYINKFDNYSISLIIPNTLVSFQSFITTLLYIISSLPSQMENIYDGVSGEVSFGPYYWPSAQLMKEYTSYLVSLDDASFLEVIPSLSLSLSLSYYQCLCYVIDYLDRYIIYNNNSYY